MAHDELSCHQACLSSPPGDSQSLRASKLLLPHIQNVQQQKKLIFRCKIFIIECLNKVQRSAMLWLCGGNKNKIIHLKLWIQLIICRQAFSGIFACLCSFTNSIVYLQPKLDSLAIAANISGSEGCCNILLFLG